MTFLYSERADVYADFTLRRICDNAGVEMDFKRERVGSANEGTLDSFCGVIGLSLIYVVCNICDNKCNICDSDVT